MYGQLEACGMTFGGPDEVTVAAVFFYSVGAAVAVGALFVLVAGARMLVEGIVDREWGETALGAAALALAPAVGVIAWVALSRGACMAGAA